MRRTLIIGPAHSGKSAVARLVANTQKQEPSELSLGAAPRGINFTTINVKDWPVGTIQDHLWDALDEFNEDVHVVIVENVQLAGLNEVIEFLTTDAIVTSTRKLWPGEVIVTCECDLLGLTLVSNVQYLHRYLVINCGPENYIGVAAMVIDPSYFTSNQAKLTL